MPDAPSPVATGFAVLGACLLLTAFGLALGETFYGLVVRSAPIVLATLAGGGGACLGMFLVLAPPRPR